MNQWGYRFDENDTHKERVQQTYLACLIAPLEVSYRDALETGGESVWFINRLRSHLMWVLNALKANPHDEINELSVKMIHDAASLILDKADMCSLEVESIRKFKHIVGEEMIVVHNWVSQKRFNSKLFESTLEGRADELMFV